jgi:hypothetical protein
MHKASTPARTTRVRSSVTCINSRLIATAWPGFSYVSGFSNSTANSFSRASRRAISFSNASTALRWFERACRASAALVAGSGTSLRESSAGPEPG